MQNITPIAVIDCDDSVVRAVAQSLGYSPSVLLISTLVPHFKETRPSSMSQTMSYILENTAVQHTQYSTIYTFNKSNLSSPNRIRTVWHTITKLTVTFSARHKKKSGRIQNAQEVGRRPQAAVRDGGGARGHEVGRSGKLHFGDFTSIGRLLWYAVILLESKNDQSILQ